MGRFLGCLALDSIHGNEIIEIPPSRRKYQKVKPAAVVNYNKNKIYVGRSDQTFSQYSFQRKLVTWWKEVFFHLFNLATVNAHNLHIKRAQKVPLSVSTR
jgi:hypothetical protein